MTPNSTLFDILGGPSKWDLLSAFGNAHTGQIVEFQYRIQNGRIKIHLACNIQGLEHEGDSGDSWNFKATAEMPNGTREHIKGYYSSHGRVGHFKIVS
jgi:hypothetical protein